MAKATTVALINTAVVHVGTAGEHGASLLVPYPGPGSHTLYLGGSDMTAGGAANACAFAAGNFPLRVDLEAREDLYASTDAGSSLNVVVLIVNGSMS